MEAPDITARICGICPVAYQMSACHAIEDLLGLRVNEPLRALRRLLYCGEWVESHALHIFLLHAPDFLGYPDALAMAKDHPDVVRRGLRLKKAGNAIMSLLGGREIHPVNVRVGGFYRAPSRAELRTLLPEIEWGRAAARQTLAWLAGLTFPDFERDYTFVALRGELFEAAEPTAIIPLLATLAPVILVDAVIGGGSPGQVMELSPERLDPRGPTPLSTHGVGVIESIELARTPSPEVVSPRIRIVGVTIARPDRYRQALSPEVAAAVPCAAAAVVALVEHGACTSRRSRDNSLPPSSMPRPRPRKPRGSASGPSRRALSSI